MKRSFAAAAASAAGISFASGQRMVMFFSQTGSASWIGVLTASVVFGIVCGAVRLAASQTGAEGAGGICLRGMGMWAGRLFWLLWAAILCSAAVMMTAALGRLSELALPVRNAKWMGVLLSVATALILCQKGMRGFYGICPWTLTVCLLYLTALTLDPREAPVRMHYETVSVLSGSVGAAVLLGMLCGALSGCIAGAVCVSGEEFSPVHLALGCGSVMLLMLAAADAAILSGGEKLLSQPLPYVILAARWGKAGFYASVLSEGLASLTTLSAALAGLAGAFGRGRES